MSQHDPVTAEQDEVDELIVRCARHPRVETGLRCGRCGTPVCPKCMVQTPVGVRCQTCSPTPRLVLSAGPADLTRAGLLGLAVAAIGTLIVSFVPYLGLIGFALVGFGTGEAISRGAKRRRGKDLAIMAVVVLVVGYALGLTLVLLRPLLASPEQLLAALPSVLLLVPTVLARTVGSPLVLVGVLIGALLAWMRVR